MIYTKEHHEQVCNYNSEWINIANNIQWLTDNNPIMKIEYELLLALISKDYNRIRENIMPFVFREDENFMEDLCSMYNKVFEAELDNVYEDLMASLEIDYDEATDTIAIRQWDREE
jgi:hypothetical protein